MQIRDKIVSAHIQVLMSGHFPVIPAESERKFYTAEEVKQALLSGEVIPSLTRQALFKLPPAAQIGASVGIFSAGTEKRLHSLISGALSQLGI